MEEIQVSQVTVNISEGQVGDDVEKAKNLLEKLTDQEAIKTESGENSKTFGLRSGLNIGATVTLRGEKAKNFLEKVLPAINHEIPEESFDGNGNFGFGVSEYIDIPGVDYDADIGMKGLEVVVTLERPGYRVKKRDHKPNEIGKEHKITDEEAQEFVQEELDIEVTQ